MGRELQLNQQQTIIRFRTLITTRNITASTYVEVKHIRAVEMETTLGNPEIAPQVKLSCVSRYIYCDVFRVFRCVV